ncbi:site-specific DNA-methyltransferase [Eubacterium ventriosum]|uniref:site-specific DNA-methyltransferase n=1 Tax=Eubacterium ventriosum TaxID=39496 RepID=UPI002673DDFC|nr:site-specific DNA-methyltransferase [Eubacterium ventriosum]
MDKLKMQTVNKADENFKKLAAMFPNAVTETIDKTGEVVRAIDKDILMQEISCKVVDGKEERYQFTWPDKKKSVLLANAPINKTLRPVRDDETIPTGADSEGKPYCSSGSVDFDNTENLYIEGDNLEALKLLQETYLGKIKMIYIDPPYNTGNDFVYEDNFAQGTNEYMENSGQFDEEGNRMVQNTESNGRFHTDWLNMIYPRLRLARDLLAENGVLVISIDDNEIDNMRKCCNDILGESNLVNCFIWNCSTAGGIRPKFASKTHEYILVYAKNKNELDMIYAPLSSDAIKMYTQKDEKGKYRDKDFVFKNKSTNVNQKYGIECPDGEVVYPKDGYIYRYIRSKFENALQEKAVTFKKTNTGPLITSEGKQAHWNIYIRKYLGSAMGAPSTLIPKEMMSIYNVGTQCVQDLFDGVRVFDNVKPVDVIVYLLNMLTFNGDTILDFFSGSATTAHAVMQLNAENGGNRKFIMVQLPEKTDEKSEAYKAGYKNICEIGKERIRRSAKKIAKENPETKFDGGFRVLKCDSSNMKDVYYTPDEYELSLFSNLEDNIKDDRSSEDLLFQVMLDLGVLLSSKIEETIIAGKRVLNVEDNYLIACFDENVTEEVIIEIAKQKPYYFIMRDSSMATDSVATNFEQIFAAYSPDTVRKVL